MNLTHILFSAAAGGTLRQLLRSRGSEDRAIALDEYLDWGPIGCALDDRIAWLETHSPSDCGWDWLAESVGAFCSEAAAAERRLIWVCPRRASEQAGLYWYLDQFGGDGAELIVADYPLEGAWRGEPPRSLAELSPEFLAQLLDGAPRALWDDQRFPKRKWKALIDEGALLRIVQDGELQSVSADHFDELILQQSPETWTSQFRIMGQIMADASSEEGHMISDSFIRWRFNELVAKGRLELDGDLSIHGAGEGAARLRRVG